jgi:hypothetical protein
MGLFQTLNMKYINNNVFGKNKTLYMTIQCSKTRTLSPYLVPYHRNLVTSLRISRATMLKASLYQDGLLQSTRRPRQLTFLTAVFLMMSFIGTMSTNNLIWLRDPWLITARVTKSDEFSPIRRWFTL